jgi:hypothetical protein
VDEALDAIKTAGFQLTGMLGPVGGGRPLPTAEALAALKEQLEANSKEGR